MPVILKYERVFTAYFILLLANNMQALQFLIIHLIQLHYNTVTGFKRNKGNWLNFFA